jgi:chitin disaccharide deacetylase
MFMNGLRFAALPAVRRQLEAEIRAQFTAFADTGLVLDHVNAHKHFHVHPSLLQMMIRVGDEFGLPAVRVPDEPLWAARHGGAAITGSAAAVLMTPWLTLMKRRLRSAGVMHNDQVFGIAFSGSMDEARLLQILARLPSGITEIYLHPATESGHAIAPSMGTYRHADELAALLSPRVRAAVAAAGVCRGGYRDFLQ